MKKFLAIVCSILILYCLFAVAFHWYFHPSRIHQSSDEETWKALVSQLDDDNAASYYLQACKALDDSTWNDSLFESYEDALENGWQREDPDLEDYLIKNEPAMELIRKGTQQKFCSMPPYDLRSVASYFSGFREIARLMVIKGRLLVWRKEYAEAGRTYSDILRFSADVSDNGNILHSLTGMALEGLAYMGVESFLAQLDEEAVCNTLLEDMIDIESGRVPLRRILERRLAYDLKYYEENGQEFFYDAAFSDRPKVVKFFVGPIEEIHAYLMFRVFKTRYLKETERFGRYIIDLSGKPYPEILRENLKEKIPKNPLSKFAFGVIPDFMLLTARHETEHRANIIRVALHLHLVQSGTYPEKLDELAGLIPEEVLIDPFFNDRFIYKKIDNGYLLYSVGVDMKDDGGVRAKAPWTKDTHGDIVFPTPHIASADPSL
jgi:hypothetical protein